MTLGSKIVESAKSGLELAEAGEQTTRAWSAMGVPKDQIKDLSNNMVELRNESGFAAGDIKNIQKQFYGFTGSAGLTENLTRGVTALAVASGKGSETADGLTGSFKRIESQGKLTSMAFARMTAQAPALPKQLASALNMSQDQLKKAVADGSISADQFTQAIAKIGAYSSQTFADFGKTGEGVMAQIKGGWMGVKSTLMQPLVDTKTSGLESVRNLLQSKDMTALAHSVGEGLSYMATQAANVISYIAAHQKDINGIIQDLTQIVVILAKSIWSTVSGIVKDIASAFGLVSDSAKKSGDPLKQIESALDAILKHKSAIQEFGKILVAAFAVKKITGFIIGFQDLQKAFEKTAAFSTAQKSIATFGDTLNSTGKIFPAFGSALKAVPFTIWITAISTIVIALVELYKHNAKFRNFVNGIIDSIKQFYKDVVKWLGDAISWVRKTFGPFFNEAVKAVQNVWKQIEPIVSVGMKVVSSAIQLGIDLIVDIWKIGWGLVSTYLKAVWAIMKPIVDLGMAVIKSVISGALKVIERSWRAVWDAIVSILKMAWAVMKPLVLSSMNAIADIIKLVSDIIHGRWNKVWGDIKAYYTDIWNGISGAIHGFMSTILDVISHVLDAINSVWRSMWSGLGDFFKGIWKGIKEAAQDGINGVLNVINAGVDAIDTVWKFFTGHETSIHHLKPVKFAQGGVVHTRLSMINDGAGQNWKELLQLPSGELKMSHQRNAVMPLPVGTRIYNGNETANIMHSAGVQHYADGGIVGDAIDWTKGKLSDIGSWIGDKADAVEKFMKDPLGNISKVLHKATDGLFKGAASFGDLATGTIDKLASVAVDKFKDMLSQTQQKIESENTNGPSGPAVDRWRSVIGQATDILHHAPLSGSQISHLLAQIATESGGDNNIVQKVWDVNMANGNPAQGLLQFIPKTFEQWAIGGHTNIKNGLDQIIAAIRRLDAMGTWNYIGQGHGWWTGGHPTTPQLAPIAEHGDEFVVNPRMGNAMQLINEAYERTMQEQPQLRDATTPSIAGLPVNTANTQSDESRSGISTKLLDTIIERLTEIRDKNDDTYLDGEKVTKTTERVSAGRYRMAEAQGQA
nr:tape measure protein [Furfurilactobacillus milii]